MKTASTSANQPTRYAVRQVLDQELRKEKMLQASAARQARGSGAPLELLPLVEADSGLPEPKVAKIKRDFFGRPVAIETLVTADAIASTKIDASTIAKSTATKGKAKDDGADGGSGRIWVSFHEGFSNAVRKPITLTDLMDSF